MAYYNHVVYCLLKICMNKLLTAAVFCRCVEQINKANRGDISQEDLKEKQVSLLDLLFSVSCWVF
jgi:hypothetical protein